MLYLNDNMNLKEREMKWGNLECIELGEEVDEVWNGDLQDYIDEKIDDDSIIESIKEFIE